MCLNLNRNHICTWCSLALYEKEIETKLVIITHFHGNVINIFVVTNNNFKVACPKLKIISSPMSYTKPSSPASNFPLSPTSNAVPMYKVRD